MTRVLLLVVLIFSTLPLLSQGRFETKIIIADSLFYAVEIENQAAKLYIGEINQPIDSANVYALPAGTKRRSANFLPFSWDIFRDTIYAINFTEHPQNSRLTSLKSIPLRSLKLYDPTKVQQQLLEAARLNGTIMNLPLKNTIAKYKYMDNLFFDVVMDADTLYQFICVNDELTVWRYSHGKWEQSEISPFEAAGYFLVYVRSNQLFIINDRGGLFQYNTKLIKVESSGFPLAENILVINRDAEKTSFVNRNVFHDTSLTVQSILEKYGK